MKQSWIENIIAGSYAIALHIVLMTLFFISLDSEADKVITPASVDIVQATMLNEQEVLDDIADRRHRLEEQEAEKKVEEDARLEAMKQKKAAEKAAKERAQREREEEQLKIEREKQRQIDQKREQKRAEQKKAEAEATRKVEAEKQRLAAEKQRIEKQEAAELKKQQQAEEKKRQAEEAQKIKVEKERKAAEVKKRQDAEKQRLGDEVRRKKEEANRLLQESLDAEEIEREEQRISGVVNQHMGMIRQRIKRYWSEPGNATQGMQCTLRVNLLPGGDLRQVIIIKSSGNAVFDRSAESAVHKAAPWPQPNDPKAAAALRDFTFVFKPK